MNLTLNGSLAEVRFNRFDLENYALFLKCKKLPESQLAYDWEVDTYTLTTPARFLPMLGLEAPPRHRSAIELHARLFDYEQFIVKTAFEARRYAIYADCGLGKTFMFLEWARHVIADTGGRVLIFSPLNIIDQTVAESTLWYGDSLPVERLSTRRDLEVWLKGSGPALGIANYDQMIPGQLSDLRLLAGLICDESSVLKSGGGVIKWNLIKSARGIEYKLSCTATPAPNDIMEYASQAAFLEKLRHEGEILWTFFTRDKEGNWRIKPHAREGFYRFLASWSIYLRNPATYGWKDNLAQIPPPQFHEYKIDATPEQLSLAHEIFGGGSDMHGDKLGITQRGKLSQLAKGFIYRGKAAVPVESLKPAFIADLVRQERKAGRQVLVWTVFDEEARLISRELGDKQHAVLDGSVKQRDRAGVLARFKSGEIPDLISKASMLGFGHNLQHCTSMIFSGWDDSYERFYQAVRRALRYGQTQTVHIHLPFIPPLEGMIWENILRKKDNFDKDADMQEKYYKMALEGLINDGNVEANSRV